ncbi:hypothetical protein DNU06_13145 [Putridiphycobacter roseus]|uniref:PKD domain-containing protein n=1 Tax=Putridiphycobacter roseus TaxID=2219161 RepID=A0A2W1MXB9_9FLAO|nr:PKD domain-containing protein [Putridiphycobacter roseus]PZE16487.1 hypothetical protein DNU06_13145 [Putridiphycobacter roseus]
MKKLIITAILFLSVQLLAQNPGNIGTANLTAWFKPDGLAIGNVTSWTTTFPIGAGAISVTDATTPYPQATNTPAGNISNYNTTIEFDANTATTLKALQNTSNLDLLDNSSTGDEGTFFAAYYLPATTTNDHMVLYKESGSTSDAIQFRNLGATGRLAIGNAPTNSVNACRNWTESFTPTIISYKGNRSGLTTMEAYQSSLLFTTSAASQASGPTGLYFGTGVGAGPQYNGFLHEFIFYNADLTAVEMAKVHSYLAVKYGVTLDNTGGGTQGDYQSTAGDIIWDASVFPNYHHDVIGIGRDDNQGLLQKQSHTFNDAYRLYVANIATTNVGNTGAVNMDNAFVTMGSDQGVACATAAANAEVPVAPILFSRIEREWKITKTNFSQPFNVDIQLDPCAVPANFEFDCMRLLVDDDGDFSNATVYDAASGLGFNYNPNGMVSVSGIANLHIPDNSTRYITLGSVNIPTADLGNDTLLCQGQSLLLDVTTPGATYLWQNASTGPTFNVTGQGTYWVEVSNGVCTVRDTIIVSTLALATDLGNDTTICQGETLLLDGTAPGASYLWQDNTTNPSFSVTTTGTYWVELTVGACVERDSIVVTVNPLPIVNLGPDTILCENANLVLSDAVVGATYLWQDASVNTTFNVASAGGYWLETTLNGCVARDSINVVYQQVSVDLGNDTNICQNQTLLLDATTANATYLWQDNSTNPTFNVVQAGQYFVEVTVNACTADDTINVTYTQLPTPDLGNDTTLCEGQSLLLDVFETNATYAWQDNSTNQDFNVTTAGTYDVDVTFNGCQASDAIIVSYTALPIVSLGNDTTLCPNATLSLLATNSSSTYLWQNGAANASFLVSAPGKYYVQVTRGNCPIADTIEVAYYNSLGLLFPNYDTICVGTTINFTHNVAAPSISESNWDFGDFSNSNLYLPSHQYDEPGNYTITLTVKNSGGCEEVYTTSIVVVARPDADFVFSPTSPLKDEVVEFQNLSTGGSNYFWQFGDGASAVDVNPTHIYLSPKLYQVTLTASNPYCDNATFASIEVRDELLFYIPNSFTPADIGSANSNFQPVFVSGYNPYVFHMLLFNRYGEVVFESFDASQGWDGRYQGEMVKQGVYVWRVQFGELVSDKKTIAEGHVTVLR